MRNRTPSREPASETTPAEADPPAYFMPDPDMRALGRAYVTAACDGGSALTIHGLQLRLHENAAVLLGAADAVEETNS